MDLADAATAALLKLPSMLDAQASDVILPRGTYILMGKQDKGKSTYSQCLTQLAASPVAPGPDDITEGQDVYKPLLTLPSGTPIFDMFTHLYRSHVKHRKEPRNPQQNPDPGNELLQQGLCCTASLCNV